MGLHLQRHQAFPPKPELRPSRPSIRNYDCTIHGRVRKAAHQDMPQAGRTRYGPHIFTQSR